ncbi:GNAT family N-acetyltransferase [Citricoccus sp. GCM10030269]|uniref:GNAT family N-acetyltransferase n=1 Tax=Citricoccus sp. GCM10030269 TaxID=3273388 RepID=UPI003610CB05
MPPPNGFSMRPMQRLDLPVVHELEKRLFPQDAWPMSFFVEELSQAGPAADGGTRDYRVVTGRATDASASEATGEPNAEDGADVVVGYCGLMCVPPLADVQTIAVVPEAEGRGLGTAMLEWMVAEARLRRAQDLLLEVRADNSRAQALYRRHGFEHIHTRAGYYPGCPGGPIDALIMRRRLTG